MSGEKFGKKKILICGIVVVLLLICGAIVVVASMNREDTTQEEEMEEEDKDQSQLGGFGEYVDTSRKNKDCMTIGSMMDVIYVTAADPAINWKTEEVTVIFTEDGGKYICGNADVIKCMSDIMPQDSAGVSQWSNGWEIRAQKDLSTGVPFFSFRGDYEALKEFKPDLAARFDRVLEN